ncbi:hypothetical protein Hc94105_0557 [Helicobacter cinaedi]|nr:hypothetical protein Hc94105_0557 [Helicobacter cinaedi]
MKFFHNIWALESWANSLWRMQVSVFNHIVNILLDLSV